MDLIRTVLRSVKHDDKDHGPSTRGSSNSSSNTSAATSKRPSLRTLAVERSTAAAKFSGSHATSHPRGRFDDNAVIHAVVDREQPEEDQPSSLLPPPHHQQFSAFSTTTDDDEGRSEMGPAEIPCEFAADEVVGYPSSSRKVDDDEDDDDDDEDEEDYEYEDEDESPFTGFLVDNPTIAASRSDEAESGVATAGVALVTSTHPTKIEDEEVIKPKWREPTRAAVNMSLRAEQETSGSKRRLAQDLYRIMNQDTQEAGFSLQPSSEDSMDKWTIKLFQFDEDSNLAKDMRVLGLDAVELEMTFPDQYPFEPPFVRVVRPRFKKQTGFVMNGALCMELLTKDGWNPINDIESVIVSVRSLLVVGDGRLEAAASLSPTKYAALLVAAAPDEKPSESSAAADGGNKRQRKNSAGESVSQQAAVLDDHDRRAISKQGGAYSVSEAKAAYSHLSDYHKKKGWDSSGWWARKG